ncbi:MAG: ParA family protein, partial [Phycisphaerae bacterium]
IAERGLRVIPSSIDLAAAETELVSVVGREVILRDRLAELTDQVDWLLIDCPPSFGVLSLNAMVAADEVIVPLQAHFLALQGVGKLLETVELVHRRINPALRVAGFVLCIHEAGTRLAGEVVDDLQRFIAEARDQDVAWNRSRIFDARIRRNIKLAECPSYGQSIIEYAPKSKGAQDYLSLADELLSAAVGDVGEPDSADASAGDLALAAEPRAATIAATTASDSASPTETVKAPQMVVQPEDAPPEAEQAAAPARAAG